MENSNKEMVKTHHSDGADLFTKRLVVSLCTPFPDLKIWLYAARVVQCPLI